MSGPLVINMTTLTFQNCSTHKKTSAYIEEQNEEALNRTFSQDSQHAAVHPKQRPLHMHCHTIYTGTWVHHRTTRICIHIFNIQPCPMKELHRMALPGLQDLTAVLHTVPFLSCKQASCLNTLTGKGEVPGSTANTTCELKFCISVPRRMCCTAAVPQHRCKLHTVGWSLLLLF